MHGFPVWPIGSAGDRMVRAMKVVPDADERARQRRTGGLLAYVQIVVNVGIALAYTPFLVRSLGQADYGLFAIAGALASYLVILDMGLSDSVVRRLVGLHGANDVDGEKAFLGGMFSLYGAIGIAVVGAACLAILGVPWLFGGTLDSGSQRTLQAMLAPLGLGTAAVVGGNPLNAALVAYERFVFLRTLEMATVMAVTAISVAVLLNGGGAVAVVAVSSSGAVCAVAVKWWHVRRSLGIATAPRRVRWPQVREMAVYASPIFASMLVEQIFWKLDHILIGARIGAAAVAIYAIGVMFNKYFMAFATAISRVMMPDLVRRIDAGSDAVALTARLVEVSRWQAVVAMLVLSGLILFGQHFIRTWMGPGYELSYWVMALTLGAYSIELIGNVRNVVLQVKGLYWWRAGIFLAAALLNIPATIIALEHWGIVGAAVCSAAGLLSAYLGVAWVLSAKVGIHIVAYWREVWRGIGPALAIALLVGAVIRMSGPDVDWLPLLAKISVYSIVYLSLMWAIGLNTAERDAVRAAVRSRRRA